MRTWRVLAALGVLVASLVTALPVAAQEGSGPSTSGTDVLVLLDISESMGEDAGGETSKIDGARAVLQSTVAGAPDNLRFGLRVYPAPGSQCGSGSLMHPVGALTLPATPGLESLAPAGDTPTADALEAAVADLPADGQRTIFLISDGEWNCDRDPCPVAADIAASGIDIQVNTFGYQISDTGAEQLGCIANVTGGVYRDITDLDDLEDALLGLVVANLSVTINEVIERPADAEGNPSPVDVTATLTSEGPVGAEDASLVIRLLGDYPPVVFDALRSLGNIPAGESRTVTWRFTPVPSLFDYELEVFVRGDATNGPSVVATEAIDVDRRELYLELAGPVLRSAENAAAVGDSFTSGEGRPPFLTGTAESWNSCHRSINTYGTELWPVLEIIACSGARAPHLDWPQPGRYTDASKSTPEPPQAEQLEALNALPDVVVLTLGGNDAEFDILVQTCLFAEDCENSTVVKACNIATDFPLQPDGCPAGEYADMTAAEMVDLVMPGVSDTLVRYLPLVDDAVNGQSLPGDPARQIVVLAYPKLVPEDPDLQAQCGPRTRVAPGVELEEGEVDFAVEIVERLNDEVESAVSTMVAQGRPFHFAGAVEAAFYADLYHPSITVCDDPTGVVPPSVLNAVFGGGVQSLFHPNPDGYRAMAFALFEDSQSWEPLARAPQLVTASTACTPEEVDPDPITLGTDQGLGLDVDGCYEVALDGLIPGTPVSVYLASDIVSLGGGVVDADGSIRIPFRVPEVPAGDHRLITFLVNDDSGLVSLNLDVEVRRAIDFGPMVLPLSLASIASMALLGMALLWRDRQQRRAAEVEADG